MLATPRATWRSARKERRRNFEVRSVSLFYLFVVLPKRDPQGLGCPVTTDVSHEPDVPQEVESNKDNFHQKLIQYEHLVRGPAAAESEDNEDYQR